MPHKHSERGLVLLSGMLLLGLLAMVTLGQLQLQSLAQRLQGHLQLRQQLFYQASTALEAYESQLLAASKLPQACTASCPAQAWFRTPDQYPALPPAGQPAWWRGQGQNLAGDASVPELRLTAALVHQDGTTLPGYTLLYVELSLQAWRPQRHLAAVLRSQLRLVAQPDTSSPGWQVLCNDSSLALHDGNDCRRLGWVELG